MTNETVKSFTNQKPWKNGDVRAKNRAEKLPFGYLTRSSLKAGIKEAKQRHQKRDLNTNNTKDVWHAIQNITGYESKGTPIVCESTL